MGDILEKMSVGKGKGQSELERGEYWIGGLDGQVEEKKWKKIDSLERRRNFRSEISCSSKETKTLWESRKDGQVAKRRRKRAEKSHGFEQTELKVTKI